MKGPAWFLAGIGLWALLDANSKLLAGAYGWAQVVGVRYAVLLLLVLGLRMLRPGLGGSIRTSRPGLNLLRALANFGSAVSFFLALRHIPLAEGYLVYFTAPFLTLALASAALGERMPQAAWGWTGVGFAGVLVALWPGLAGQGNWQAYLWALFGTFCYALVMTTNRALRGEYGAARVVVWPSVVGLVLSLPWLALEWRTAPAADLLLLALNGAIAGAATLCLAQAFRHADAGRLAPYEFSALVWAMTLDLLVWSVLPAPATLAGAAVVVFACLMGERAATRARRDQGKSSGKTWSPSDPSGSGSADRTAESGNPP